MTDKKQVHGVGVVQKSGCWQGMIVGCYVLMSFPLASGSPVKKLTYV